MYKLPHELPNDLITLKLENLNKIPEMLGFFSPTENFDIGARKLQKSGVKYSVAKAILLDFVNLSTISCVRLQWEILSRHSELVQKIAKIINNIGKLMEHIVKSIWNKYEKRFR